MKKTISIILGLILIMVLCISCGAERAAHEAKNEAAEAPDYLDEEFSMETEDSGAGQVPPEYGLKIVYSTYLYIETLDYEESYQAIMAALAEAGGYVSYSDQSGGYSNAGVYTARRVYLELKVPAEQYSGFLNQSGGFGNVTNRSDSTQDITSSYIDVEARLNALKLQEERLLELLEQADSIETILQIEAQLSNVRYEIELYTSQLNAYDNMVAFSTVSIELSEVSTISPNPTKDFWQQVKDALQGSVQSVGAFLRGLVIVIIYMLPYAAGAAIVYFAIVRPLAKRRRKARADHLAQNNKAAANPDMPTRTDVKPKE